MAARTMAERLLEEGRQQGRQEVRQEGRQEVRREVLLDLLAERFGRVPGDVAERVRSAGVDELKIWSRAVLRAPDLAAVFKSAA